MTREETIEYFKGYRKIFCENYLKICPKDSIAYQATLKEKEFYDMAIKALEQTRWISCTERLPEDGDTYLVTIEYNGKVIGVDAASYSPVEGYIDKHWDTFNDWKEDEDSCYHVTAWMPLPEPYEPTNQN